MNSRPTCHCSGVAGGAFVLGAAQIGIEQILHPVVDDLLGIVQEERFPRNTAARAGRCRRAVPHRIDVDSVVRWHCSVIAIWRLASV